MTNKHSENINIINDLKNQFNDVKTNYNEVQAILNNLDEKIKYLKHIYHDLLGKNHDQLLVFGLDSFKFQNKVIDLEYSQMKTYFSLLWNRVYCDYYRLHTLIIKYVRQNFKHERKLLECIEYKIKLPKYDYLHVYKEYSFTDTNNVFLENVKLIEHLNEHYNDMYNDIQNEQKRELSGLNISNFVNTRSYTNDVLCKQIRLYLNYLNFFIGLQSKYLSRYVLKAKIMYGQIMKDITFDNHNQMSKTSEIPKHQLSIDTMMNQPKLSSKNKLSEYIATSDTMSSRNLVIDETDHEAINNCIEQSNLILQSDDSASASSNIVTNDMVGDSASMGNSSDDEIKPEIEEHSENSDSKDEGASDESSTPSARFTIDNGVNIIENDSSAPSLEDDMRSTISSTIGKN